MVENTTESTVTVKWVFILFLVISVFGFFFTSVLSQENRITRVETQFEAMSKNIIEIKAGICELRTMQIKQMEEARDR
jgi:hypothetical protein